MFFSFFCLLIPLFCIYLGETAKLAFLFNLKDSAEHHAVGVLTSFLMTLSLVGVPSIGFFSDKNCRKKILMCCVVFEIVALILLNKAPFIAVVVQGLLGSAIVAVSRAAYLDVRPLFSIRPRVEHIQNTRLLAGISVVETIMVQALAWIAHYFLIEINLVFVCLVSFSVLFFLLMFFIDFRDSDAVKSEHELRAAKREYFSGYAWSLLVAFFLYDCGFQIPNYFLEAYSSKFNLSKEIDVVGSGIFIGCFVVWIVFLWFFLFGRAVDRDAKLISVIRKCIFFISFAYLLVFCFPCFNCEYFFKHVIGLKTLFVYSCIGGILLALIFIYFTNRVKVHERGLLYGVLEEIEILAEAVTPVVIYNFFNSESLVNIPFFILIGSGVLCIQNFRR